MKKQPTPSSKKDRQHSSKSMNGMNVGYSDEQPAPLSGHPRSWRGGALDHLIALIQGALLLISFFGAFT